MTAIQDTLDRFECWWASIPTDQRRALYRPQQLASASGVPTSQLPLVAALAGWTCARRWLVGADGRRKLRVYYAPPGTPVPASRPRGRPPLTVYTLLGRRPPTPFDIADLPQTCARGIDRPVR